MLCLAKAIHRSISTDLLSIGQLYTYRFEAVSISGDELHQIAQISFIRKTFANFVCSGIGVCCVSLQNSL